MVYIFSQLNTLYILTHIIYLTLSSTKMLNKLKSANLEQGMYCDMEVMGNESSRLDLFKKSNDIFFSIVASKR